MGPLKNWCANNNIKHELASPYNPQGNRLAEAGIKNNKNLLAKCTKTGEDPQKSLYHWRNIPRTDGFSPAQLMFGRKQFTSVPATESHYHPYNPATAQAGRDKAFHSAEKHHNQHKAFLLTLSIGDKVKFQCPNTKLWVVEDTVVEAREDKLLYIVQVGNKQQFRARRMLKLCHKRAFPAKRVNVNKYLLDIKFM